MHRTQTLLKETRLFFVLSLLLIGIVSCSGPSGRYQLRPSHPKAFRVQDVLESGRVEPFRHDQNSVNLILLDLADHTYLKKTLPGYPLVLRISQKTGSRRLTIRRASVTLAEALDEVCGRAGLVWRIEPARIAVYDRNAAPKQ